jgi:sugar phosphate isomerase/epimerase
MKSVETEDDTSIYDAEKLVAASGLKCLTLHVGSLHVKDSVEVHRAVYYGKISLEFARKLKAPVMVVHSNIARKLPEPQRRHVLKAVFDELSTYAKKLNVKLALENLSYASSGYGKNVAELEEIFRIIDQRIRWVSRWISATPKRRGKRKHCLKNTMVAFAMCI